MGLRQQFLFGDLLPGRPDEERESCDNGNYLRLNRAPRQNFEKHEVFMNLRANQVLWPVVAVLLLLISSLEGQSADGCEPCWGRSEKRDYLYLKTPHSNHKIIYTKSREFCTDHLEEIWAPTATMPKGHGVDIKAIPPNSWWEWGHISVAPTWCDYCYYFYVNEEGDDVFSYCNKDSIYSGYLHFRYNGDFPFLKRQIDYSKKYPNFEAYWPETSLKAYYLSEITVELFDNLVETTALKRVRSEENLYKEFITDSWYFDRLDFTLSRSLCVSCFRFSDFYQVCHDLNQFSRKHFPIEDCILIEAKIGEILDDLCPVFLEIYEESLSLHPTKEILEEVEFIECCYLPSKQFDRGPMAGRNLSESGLFQETSSSFEVDEIEYPESDSEFFPRAAESNQPLWFVANLLLSNGTVYNDFFMYGNAVESLTAAIKIDPCMIEAYQERATAYFEMGKLDLAIADYKKVKEIEKKNPPYSHKALGMDSRGIVTDVQYSTGFFVGICEGGACSIADLPGSTYQCCSGITNGLWSFYWANNKREVAIEFSADVIASSYLLVEFIATHTPQESAQLLVPELKELIKNWDNLSEYRKGENVGYIIGKYGVDVLVPIAAFNGLKRFRQLKRANSLLTIERCALSQAERAAIIDTSATYTARSAILRQSAKHGKVIVHNPNVIPHVMQKKRVWYRVLELSGDQMKDFEKVVNLLEENKIFSGKKEIIRDRLSSESGLFKICRYEIQVKGHILEAEFIEYLENGESYLKNAWVKWEN